MQQNHPQTRISQIFSMPPPQPPKLSTFLGAIVLQSYEFMLISPTSHHKYYSTIITIISTVSIAPTTRQKKQCNVSSRSISLNVTPCLSASYRNRIPQPQTTFEYSQEVSYLHLNSIHTFPIYVHRRSDGTFNHCHTPKGIKWIRGSNKGD